ncbi:MAG: chorismate synthase [Myxococcota bacterium]
MAGSTWGSCFRVTTAGESHGPGLVAIVDGCPAGVALSPEDFQLDMARRRPGQSRLTSPRQERDEVEILSGVFEGKTTGTPIALLLRSEDARGRDYEALREVYRPGHADFTFDAKFGRRDHRGGGRSSARETAARVAAGVVAKRLLETIDVQVVGWVDQVGSIRAKVDGLEVTLESVEYHSDGRPNAIRCPDPEAAPAMEALIETIRREKDSIGGVAGIVARNVPPGLGEPVFDKLKADLAKSLFSLPAVTGVEIGSGFKAASMRGSEHNDRFIATADGVVETETNRHGGMLGGISTGQAIELRAAVKPTSSIPRAQSTVTRSGTETSVEVRGRHDPCLLPRFVPMAEAMVAIVLADHWLRQRTARLETPQP